MNLFPGFEPVMLAHTAAAASIKAADPAILTASLFARSVARDIFIHFAEKYRAFTLLPRMNSVLLQIDEEGEGVADLHSLLRSGRYPTVGLHEGVRREQALQEA